MGGLPARGVHRDVIVFRNGMGVWNPLAACRHPVANPGFKCRRNFIGRVIVSKQAVERIGSFADYHEWGKLSKLCQ